MIVKRLASALRRQDWAAVTIEFLLVVLGVVLAFQINEWATSRREAARNLELAERLFEETQRNVSWLRNQREAASALTSRETQFATAIVHNGQCPADDDLWKSVYTVSWYPPIVVETSVYEEMMGAGGLATIRNSYARRAISRFYTELTMAKERTGFIRLQSGPALPLDHPHTIVSFDTAREDPLGVKFDKSALCRDAAFKKRVADKVRDHLFVMEQRGELVRSAIEMCSSLGRMFGQKCMPFRGGPLADQDAQFAEEAWKEAGQS